jgi:hypothetical protein
MASKLKIFSQPSARIDHNSSSQTPEANKLRGHE